MHLHDTTVVLQPFMHCLLFIKLSTFCSTFYVCCCSDSSLALMQVYINSVLVHCHTCYQCYILNLFWYIHQSWLVLQRHHYSTSFVELNEGHQFRVFQVYHSQVHICRLNQFLLVLKVLLFILVDKRSLPKVISM